MVSDDHQSQDAAKQADEEIADQESPLGHAPEDVEDIDETLASVGLPSDENGPQELNSEEALGEANKH